ncbi:HNH endonuclease [Streptomyces sp. NPDC020951]|uniref:HNH endonuclease n=1 Tax=Streptomyces sp. NPDC020951 TaxID=3365104 RepID=UPI00379BE108
MPGELSVWCCPGCSQGSFASVLCPERRCGLLVLADADRVQPLAPGGESTDGNVQPLCHSCHSAKTGCEAVARMVVAITEAWPPRCRPRKARGSTVGRVAWHQSNSVVIALAGCVGRPNRKRFKRYAVWSAAGPGQIHSKLGW